MNEGFDLFADMVLVIPSALPVIVLVARWRDFFYSVFKDRSILLYSYLINHHTLDYHGFFDFLYALIHPL